MGGKAGDKQCAEALGGDLPNWLAHYGFMVCIVDLKAEKGTDVIDEAIFGFIEKDVVAGSFEVIWCSTPAKAPDKEAKVLTDRTHDVLAAAWDQHRTWGLENPAADGDNPSLWEAPLIRRLAQLDRVVTVNFDRCRLGHATRGPTQLLVADHVNFLDLHGLTCNHSVNAHKEKASPTKQRGEYTPHLSQVVANALYQGYRLQSFEKEDL
ncbi:Eef2k [Symbiodinium natans]|uniref:Eef2k protein n=1 Tax=Symbiodinium natans TaxID=878477 RepID=A0A812Q846_9DINO|nr:Eef2k [Symbiodinium natans]